MFLPRGSPCDLPLNVEMSTFTFKSVLQCSAIDYCSQLKGLTPGRGVVDRRLMAPREEEVPDMKAPVFDLLPEYVQVEEGETAKFMVKVSGNPRPRVTWWLNGTIVVNVSSSSSLFSVAS